MPLPTAMLCPHMLSSHMHLLLSSLPTTNFCKLPQVNLFTGDIVRLQHFIARLLIACAQVILLFQLLTQPVSLLSLTCHFRALHDSLSISPTSNSISDTL